MSRLGFLLFVALILAIGTGYGCYTMVRHPGPADVSFEDSAGTTCLDCHSNADYDHWTDPYYTAFYNSAPQTWGAYYAHPWWYDEYWYRVPGGAGRDSTHVGGRHAWDRGPGTPYAPPMGGAPSISPGAHGSVSAPADTSKSGRQESKDQDQKQREEQKDQNQRRKAWGR